MAVTTMTPGGSRVKAYLEGGPELERAIRRLEQVLRDEVLATATLAGAEVLAAEWRNRVPVEDGNYKQSINARSKPGKKGATAIVTTGIVAGLARRDQPRRYAARLEFGFVQRQGGHPTGRFGSYHPSARPAFDAAQGRAIAAVEERLRQLVAAATP